MSLDAPSTTGTYPPSLHDALPICLRRARPDRAAALEVLHHPLEALLELDLRHVTQHAPEVEFDEGLQRENGRAHVGTPVTWPSRMAPSAGHKQRWRDRLVHRLEDS